MGPSATADFYTKLVTHTPAENDQEHLRVVIWADPTVPSRQDAVLEGGVDPSPWLEIGVDHLIRCGAETIVSPCNTVHLYLAGVMRSKPVTFINIIDTAVEAVARQVSAGIVGILATDAALHAGLYQRALRKVGLDVVLPTAVDQARVTQIVRGVKAGDTSESLLGGVQSLLISLQARGATAVIVGCTELSTVLAAAHGPRSLLLVDPAVELAIATVRSVKSVTA